MPVKPVWPMAPGDIFVPHDEVLREMISKIDPDATTPIEALKILAELKKHISS